MESKAKLFGHPVHPMLIVFPLGLLVTAVLFDVLRMVTGNTTLAIVSYWNIAAGVILGLLAAIPGFVDWAAIPAGTRAKAIGLWHGLGNVVVLGVFALSWWLRRDEPGFVPSNIAMALGVLAVGLGGVTGWLGGELVDRMGVGVDHGAHLDAPSSLTHRSAEESDEGTVSQREQPRTRGLSH